MQNHPYVLAIFCLFVCGAVALIWILSSDRKFQRQMREAREEFDSILEKRNERTPEEIAQTENSIKNATKESGYQTFDPFDRKD